MSAQDLPALGLVVVLAEDNDDHALLIKMALEKVAEGAVEIHRARTGTEALALVGSLHPDLLLLDLRMPGMTGHDVLLALKREKDKLPPILMLTARGEADVVRECIEAGAKDFLVKPFHVPNLLERSYKLIR